MNHAEPPTLRLRLLIVLLVVFVLAALKVPERLLTHIAFAVQRGRIEADRQSLLRQFDDRDLTRLTQVFRLVARSARPGVVQISVEASERDRAALRELEAQRQELRRRLEALRDRAHDGEPDEQDLEAFRELMDDIARLDARREQLLDRLHSGTGSGIIFDPDGYILTNNHVVEGGGQIRVRLHDGREYIATDVRTDPKTDLAVIRIDAPDLHPLTFGDSDAVEVGDWVLAVGAPFGLSHSVTHGIVSAKGRADLNVGRDVLYQDFIQTDAAINPGNSGGPLLNLRGEVIGVNTAIATNGQPVNAGVAFVIPSKMAAKVARQLRDTGTVARGWLGIGLAELDEELRDRLGVPGRLGVLVNVVYVGSAAHRAGFEVDDVVLAVRGHKIDRIRRLQALVADVGPGQSAAFTILRDGQQRELTVTLDRQPEDIDAWVRDTPAAIARRIDPLGLAGRAMRPAVVGIVSRFGGDRELASRVARQIDQTGVVVLQADRSTGPQPGDLITAADGTPVRSLADLLRILRGRRAGDEVALTWRTPEGQPRRASIEAR